MLKLQLASSYTGVQVPQYYTQVQSRGSTVNRCRPMSGHDKILPAEMLALAHHLKLTLLVEHCCSVLIENKCRSRVAATLSIDQQLSCDSTVNKQPSHMTCLIVYLLCYLVGKPSHAEVESLLLYE